MLCLRGDVTELERGYALPECPWQRVLPATRTQARQQAAAAAAPLIGMTVVRTSRMGSRGVHFALTSQENQRLLAATDAAALIDLLHEEIE
jgi:hypothetical protein